MDLAGEGEEFQGAALVLLAGGQTLGAAAALRLVSHGVNDAADGHSQA